MMDLNETKPQIQPGSRDLVEDTQPQLLKSSKAKSGASVSSRGSCGAM